MSSVVSWYGKKCIASYNLRVASSELPVESLKALVEIKKWEFKSMSSNLRATSSNPRVLESFSQWKLK